MSDTPTEVDTDTLHGWKCETGIPAPLKIMEFSPRPSIIIFFDEHQKELLRIEPDGRFFYQGNEVEGPQNIRDTFAEFASEFTRKDLGSYPRCQEKA
jgi:hypothetical protein